MVAMVTFIVTVLDLGLRSGFLLKWLEAYLIAWPVAAITAFFIMLPARRLRERIVALLDGCADVRLRVLASRRGVVRTLN
jgi:hypothetical protein